MITRNFEKLQNQSLPAKKRENVISLKENENVTQNESKLDEKMFVNITKDLEIASIKDLIQIKIVSNKVLI